MDKPKLLVVTSSYPRWEGDHAGIFIHDLNIELSDSFEIFTIAPYCKKSKKFEKIDDIKIYRFNQFPIWNIELAYGAGIVEQLKDNIFLYLIIPFFLLNQFLLVRKISKKEKISIIQTHWVIPQSLVAVIYKKIFNRKITIIGSLLGADINSFNGFWGTRIKKFIFRNIDAATAQSDQLIEKVRKINNSVKILKCPIGINTSVFNPDNLDQELKNKLDIENPFLLFAGTLIERKGIRYLIEAMPDVLNKFPKAKLVVLGDGILRNEMERLALNLHISSNIIFSGFKQPKELPAYFATCDLFILPSLSEGFPLVVMAALGSGTITLASDLPVFRQLNINEPFLSLSDIRNTKDFSSAILKLLNMPEEIMNRSKRSARKYAETNFNIKLNAGKLSALILEYVKS